MSNLVRVEAQAVLEASIGKSAYTAPTAPINLALTTTTGTTTAAGTEATGGSYARQQITASGGAGWTAASSADPPVASNVNAITFVNMPACTVTAAEIWDSAGTPKRRWFGALVASRTLSAGDTFTVAAGALTVQLG